MKHVDNGTGQPLCGVKNEETTSNYGECSCELCNSIVTTAKAKLSALKILDEAETNAEKAIAAGRDEADLWKEYLQSARTFREANYPANTAEAFIMSEISLKEEKAELHPVFKSLFETIFKAGKVL